ncbi:MAG TPA: transketolase C-terminal domain-containing protein, partial [Candidatus Wallbacteria bacterium]|nr:transketolase C-terminal domain-containing protein [Candidatus Wallbacteria bacterium]
VHYDVALQNLHVILCLDRAGLVGEDGPTHHGAFDISMFKMVPNVVIMAPSDAHELKNAVYNAVYNYRHPVVIRYPKGKAADYNPEKLLNGDFYQYENIEAASYKTVAEGKDILIISCGAVLDDCKKAVAELSEKHRASCELIDIRFVKPIGEKLIQYCGEKFDKIICVEDNCLKGGIGEEIAARLYERGYNSKKIKLIGLPDRFIEHGPNPRLKSITESDGAGILAAALAMLDGEKCRKKE